MLLVSQSVTLQCVCVCGQVCLLSGFLPWGPINHFKSLCCRRSSCKLKNVEPIPKFNGLCLSWSVFQIIFGKSPREKNRPERDINPFLFWKIASFDVPYCLLLIPCLINLIAYY